MRITLPLVGAALGLLLPAALAQSDFLSSDALHAAGLVKYWQLQLPLAAGEVVQDAYKVDDHCYFATNTGYVFAVHAPTGAIRWLQLVTDGGYRVPRPAHTTMRSRDPDFRNDPAHARHMTIFATPAEMLEVDRYTGTPLRSFDLPFPAGSGPAARGSIVVIGGINNRVYALPADVNFAYWKFGTRGQVVSQPLIHGRYVYVASDAGEVYCCKAVDKTRVWAKRIRGSVKADLVLDENGLYVPSLDHSLYLLDAQSGGLRWRARMNGALYDAPTTTADTAYQYNPVDGLVAIRVAGAADAGRIRWNVPTGRRMLAADERYAFLLGTSGALLAARLDTGVVEHTIPAPGMSFGLPDPPSQLLLMAATDGRVFCARPRGARPLTAQDVSAALFVATQAATQPTEIFERSPEEPVASRDLQTSLRPGPPVGGKSRVSREFGGGVPTSQP